MLSTVHDQGNRFDELRNESRPLQTIVDDRPGVRTARLLSIVRETPMSQPPEFEIPENVRDFAEKSVDQAKDAYSQLMDATKKAQDVVAKSSEVMTSGAKELNEKALGFAMDNMDASFKLAGQLVSAKDLQEALEIQSKFARKQMESYTEQTKEISNLMASAAKKAQPK